MMKKRLISLLILFAALIGVAPSVAARIYAVCVGIDRYMSPAASPLYYAQSDATGFARFLSGNSASDVYTVLGSNATRAKVLETLSRVAAKAGPDDVLIFYFSGHGLEGGMCVYDTQTPRTLLSYRDLSNIFKKTRARTKLIMADTCHSGTGRLEKKNGADASSLKNQNIILFLSSRSNEKSLESVGNRGGLFTYYILQGFRGKADKNGDRSISARELFEYVTQNVQRMSGGRQHPVMWGKFNPELLLLRY